MIIGKLMAGPTVMDSKNYTANYLQIFFWKKLEFT